MVASGSRRHGAPKRQRANTMQDGEPEGEAAAAAAASSGAGKKGAARKQQGAAEHEKYTTLVKLVAQLTLSLGLQVRVLKAIAISTYLLKRDIKAEITVGPDNKHEVPLLQYIKETSKKYMEDIKDLTDEQRAAKPKIHVILTGKFFEWLMSFVTAKSETMINMMVEGPQKELVKWAIDKFTEYYKKQQETSPELKYLDLGRKVRYYRADRCWKKDYMKIELGLTSSAQAQETWEWIHVILEKLCKAEHKEGVAPKANLEREVTKQLQMMGIFQSKVHQEVGAAAEVAEAAATMET
eukprot:TRINITY_DN38006_c0_g1_i1.p1 TRINITY_DN38006_c0_g1~~TRINITY_DN38006_c0_g1_i1.p1  ORF type:complete len:296 (+),score=113.75 TRINITY_DN38006_c0_g1_i1:172-1059(+)